MPKISRPLSAIEVSKLTKPGHHAVGGVPGLALQVTEAGTRSWILRTLIGSKRRDIGLGSYPTVKLADARRLAAEKKELVRRGIDPIAERAAARQALLDSQAPVMTFAEATRRVYAIVAPTLKNERYRAQWISLVERFAFPAIGGMDVNKIDIRHVLAVLEPIWHEKTDSAKKLRIQVEKILDWAITHKFREGENPARWKRNLENALPKPSAIRETRNFEAVPYQEMPGFMANLKKAEGQSARALEFLIMTAVRSGNVREAVWDEIDFERKTWTIPAHKMKVKKGGDHVVPLTDGCIEFLQALPRFEGSDYLFPSTRGGALSDMAVTAVMRRMGMTAVPHGFRATFSTWASEETTHGYEAREMALAHAITSKVEAAYRRGELLEKRRHLMEDWWRYIMQETQ